MRLLNRTIRVPRVAIFLGCFATAWSAPVRADYLLYAVSDGCTAGRVAAGETFQVELWLSADNEDLSNSIIVQLFFSSGGLVYNSLTWHGVYAGSAFDDSTPSVFPVSLTPQVLAGPGHPPGIVDIELSNVAIEPFCVGPNNSGTGACDCPNGTCIGGQCVGGAFAGLTCALNCSAGSVCRNQFTEGKLATLSFTVPPGFSAPSIAMQPLVDTIADGFVEIHTANWEPLTLYLQCVAPGDVNCDGAVTVADYGQWDACLTGPGGGVTPGCAPFDFDHDNDVDLIDWGEFQDSLTEICAP